MNELIRQLSSSHFRDVIGLSLEPGIMGQHLSSTIHASGTQSGCPEHDGVASYHHLSSSIFKLLQQADSISGTTPGILFTPCSSQRHEV